LSKNFAARFSRRQGRGERYAEGRGRRPEHASYRLFIAVEIPLTATRALVAWQQQFLASDPALRLTPAEQLHITLVFLGQMGERERDGVALQLDELGRPESFEVVVDAIVGLPRDRSPRVIAAGLKEPTGRLNAIHDKLAVGLVEKQLYKREKRPFFPHITLARARGRMHLNLSEIQPEPVKFTAVRVTLYNSILKPSGAIHQALKSVHLI
jgi:2'-5' RNA ligase